MAQRGGACVGRSSLTLRACAGEKTLSPMKLEEIRERLRAPWLRHSMQTPRPKRKKAQKRPDGQRTGPGFGISFSVKTKRCKKCSREFEPDPKLPYEPSVCAGCESYL